MCVKFPSGDLNPSSCPLHPTNTYTCRVTTAPRVDSGINKVLTESIIFFFFCHYCYKSVKKECQEEFFFNY